jgi:hypothetical protein
VLAAVNDKPSHCLARNVSELLTVASPELLPALGCSTAPQAFFRPDRRYVRLRVAKYGSAALLVSASD